MHVLGTHILLWSCEWASALLCTPLAIRCSDVDYTPSHNGLQAGRNVLSAEHATVLDEIDLLRGKLSQLERNVLTAAAMATTTNGSQPQAQQQQQAPGSAAAQGAAGGVAGGGMINIQELLASLGLGGDVAADLPAVGVGPQGQRWAGLARTGAALLMLSSC